VDPVGVLFELGALLHVVSTCCASHVQQGCLLIFFGRLADLYGRKRAFVLGTFSTAVFGLGCGFAQGDLPRSTMLQSINTSLDRRAHP
jgi:MFS family permease